MLKLKKFKANPTNCLNASIVGSGNWEECTELSHLLYKGDNLKERELIF